VQAALVADDDAAEGRTGDAAGGVQRAGAEGTVRQPSRRVDDPVTGADDTEAAGSADGAHGAALGGDDDGLPRLILGEGYAACRQRRRGTAIAAAVTASRNSSRFI
jgi:hypothetical protein